MARKKDTTRCDQQVTFEDHTGKTAIMSWRFLKGVLLPPLPSWVFYITHPEFSRENFNGVGFQRQFEQNDLSDRVGWFRYEFFFLPGASAQDCVAHYHGEMTARGTVWRQIDKVNRAARKTRGMSSGAVAWHYWAEDDDAERSENETSSGRLPGMVWSKQTSDLQYTSYCGWLFMYMDADGKAPEPDVREVCLVKFDPVPLEREDGEAVQFDPMDHPVLCKMVSIRCGYFAESGATGFMTEKGSSYWHAQANEATSMALELGWDSW